MKCSEDLLGRWSPTATTPRSATTFDYRVMKTPSGFSAYSPELHFGAEGTTIQLAVASLREAIHRANVEH